MSRGRTLLFVVLAACADGGPGSQRFLAVSAGAYHTCALAVDARAYCWGRNDYGALGTGDTAARTTPAPVGGGLRFTAIASGFLHTCAIRDNGAAFCWGINGLGELGDGTREDRTLPAAVAGGLAFFQISTGEGATCGLVVSDSGLYCWGTDLIGVNAPPGRDWTRPTRYAAGRFRAVSVGYEIACALRNDGQAFCWGHGELGQLGNADSASSDIPVAVAQPGPFDALSAGHAHACGRRSDATIWCWGSNASGELGVDSMALSSVPVRAAAGASFDSLSAHSAAHTCALIQGAAWCWGSNGLGRLGDGGGAGGFAARPVAGNLGWRQVSTGFGHSCGLTLGEGYLYCWGDNSLGQLGTGGASSSVPVAVALP